MHSCRTNVRPIAEVSARVYAYMERAHFLAHTRAQRGAAAGTDRQESRSVKSLLLTVERAVPTAEMDKKLSSDQKVGRQWPPQPLRLRRP